MTLATSTLRPGLLVSLRTSLRGNVSYETVDLEQTAEQARWETTRTIADPEEFERGKKARGLALTAVRRVCAASAFGLLCPERDADALEEAIVKARAIADDYNASAALTRLHIYVIVGKIAQDDVTAVKAINSEVRELIEDMAEGVKRMDVNAIRSAADKARGLGQMLTPTARASVDVAIKTARDVAKAIVKAGETAAIEIDTRAVRMITEQRTCFLDLSDTPEVQRPKAEGRAIAYEPSEFERQEWAAMIERDK